MKKLILLLLVMLSVNQYTVAQDWLLGYELEFDVTLVYIQYGDMSTYVGFEIVSEKQKGQEMSFAYWTWETGDDSIVGDINEFNEVEGSEFKITLRYTPVETLTYTSFEVGNEKTGEITNQWVLTKITRIK